MSSPSPNAVAAPRLSWLDALRGVAATTVLLYHVILYGMPALNGAWAEPINLGHYGVLVFFLVSGYVIAMSFERYQHAGVFWIGRVFRLYPVLIVAALGMSLLLATGYRQTSGWTLGNPVTAFFSHVTMLTEFTSARHLVGVFWTLGYEMVFYLTFSALFIFGQHRRSHVWALTLALTAFVFGAVLPNNLLSSTERGRLVLAVGLLAVLVISVAAYVSGRRAAILTASAFGLPLPLLLALNGRPWKGAQAHGSWQALAYLALMFCGSAVFHAHARKVGARGALISLITTSTVILAAHWVHIGEPGWSMAKPIPTEIFTLLAVGTTFGLAFLARHRNFPRAVAWLGKVSYSTYMLHMIVLLAILAIAPGLKTMPFWVQAGSAAGYTVIVLLISGLSFKHVEQASQRIGRRAVRRIGAARSPARPAGEPEARPARRPVLVSD